MEREAGPHIARYSAWGQDLRGDTSREIVL